MLKLGKFILLANFIFLSVPVVAQNSVPTVLEAVQQTLVVDGKPSQVFNIVQPNGVEGYIGEKGQYFNVLLKNKTPVSISIHWHGLIDPNDQDGVPYVTQLPIPPGGSHHYYFKLVQAGTFWMHSHYKFHEQQLMAAPLILKDPQDPNAKDREVVVFLHDFTFKSPEQIFKDLKTKSKQMGSMKMDMSKPDLNDVDFNYFLANRRTLKNPEIIRVLPGSTVRLRMINGASASNFWVNTGNLLGTVIATDGADSHPFSAQRFQLPLAERLDILVTLPKTEGVYPILAQVEGTNKQTGIILATPQAKIPTISETANTVAPALNNQQEMQLHALHPLVKKPVITSLPYILGGNMQEYVWTINNQVWPRITPLKIKNGDRVEMVFTNNTNMAHPMHFHGHVFQLTELNGKPLSNGPLRDTILVLPHQTDKIIFDADNPGIWMLHCHVLYHLQAGMMTTTNYYGYPEPEYYKKLLAGKISDF